MARSDDTRAARVRAPRGGMTFGSLRDLPADMVPEGQEFLLVNEEVRGERQRDNLFRRMNYDGFTPVKRSDLPGFAPFTLEQDKPTDEYVREGGQILMSRPKDYGDEDRADQVALARQAESDATRKNVVENADRSLSRPDTAVKTVVRRERPRPQDFPE